MRITVKLFALLGRYLPAGAVDNTVEIEVGDGTTPADVIRRLALPLESCHLVLVNGHYVTPGERDRRRLDPGDALAIWPPIAGGNPDTPEAETEAATEAAAGLTVEKEMSISHAEFLRLLPRALDGAAHRRDGDRIVAGSGDRRLEITLSPQGERKMGLLTLPVTRVRLAFVGYPTDEAAAALARFDRSFQRGGG